MNGQRLSTRQMIGYSLPAFGAALVMLSVAVYLPNYYTDELGLSAGLLSWVLMAGRLWDAVTDPVMGHLSDRTRTRWGRRRPYFLVAALPLGLFYYLIWAPAPGLSAMALFSYLLVCYLALYTFWTIFWIPYISLGMELTPEYHDRTRLFGTRQGFYLLGTAAGMLLPEAFAKAAGSSAAGYPTMALVFGSVCALLVLAAFFRLEERHDTKVQEQAPFIESLRITFRNRAFVVLMFTYLIALVGGSFIAPLTLYVAKYVINAREVVPLVMLSYLAGSVVSIPLWVRLSTRQGKNRTWTFGMLLASAVYATSFYYHEGTWLLWIVLAAVVGAANGCTMTLGPSISADVIDSDELETGRRREGVFMGIWSFMDKAAIGLAIFLGMQGLDWIGYVPNQEQTPEVVLGIKFLYCVLPAICHIGALLVFRSFPITPEVHAEIRAALDERAAAAGAGR
ncbi:Glucuronide carrier protein [Myxococcaceae bacterium]|nr:Glucuronide carrier protein [Myxococcaceae bacterium]